MRQLRGYENAAAGTTKQTVEMRVMKLSLPDAPSRPLSKKATKHAKVNKVINVMKAFAQKKTTAANRMKNGKTTPGDKNFVEFYEQLQSSSSEDSDQSDSDSDYVDDDDGDCKEPIPCTAK